MKKLFVSLLAFCVLLGLSACGNNQEAVDDSDPKEEKIDLADFEWKNTDDGIEITNYKGNSERVVVPDTIENKEVVSIGKAFCGNVTVQTLVLSENIRKLDGSSLENCDALKRLEGPGVAHFVGDELDLENLEELVMPVLEELDLDDIEDCDSLRYLEIPGVEYIRTYRPRNGDMLYWPETLEEVVIPEGMWARTNGWYDWDDEDPGYHPIGGLLIEAELEDDEDADSDDFRYKYAFTEITEENKTLIYCHFFQKDAMVVNEKDYHLSE